MMKYPLLLEGNSGNAVKVWQTVLGPPTKVDGAFGPSTRKATKRWQKAHDIPATGNVDERTWNAYLLTILPSALGFAVSIISFRLLEKWVLASDSSKSEEMENVSDN